MTTENISKLKKDQSKRFRWSGLFFGIIIATCLVVGSLIIKALFYTPQNVVMVQFNDTQCVIKDKFELLWMHSVEKQWWIESYEARDGQLLLTDTYLQTFGAGTPSTEQGGESSQKYPGYVLYQINSWLPELNWMISSNIKAQIITHKKRLPIYQWVSDYTNIYIFARTQSLWTLLRQESCNDYVSTE